LTRRVAESVPIPVIACGGAGSVNHLYEVVGEGKADAVCVASLLHYDFIRRDHTLAHDSFEEEGNIEYLKSKRDFTKVEKASVIDIKNHLSKNDVTCRPNSHC